MKRLILFIISGFLCLSSLFGNATFSFAATASQYEAVPPFVTAGVPPLVMLVMGKNHKLYYEAYNDASDLNGDGELDVGYKPDIDYYGYFDSYKCYTYNSGNSRFEPSATTTNKKCSAAGEWSGDFLNYLTMSRMDCLRKVLYGGYRSTDTATETVLQRVYVPQDAHSWGKGYESIGRDGYDISEYTPLDLPTSGTRHLFASTTLSDNGDPLLRVLPNNSHRIWEWVSKERPVCDNSLETGSGGHPGHPANHSEYESLVLNYAVPANLQGSQLLNGEINGSGNPFGNDDDYLTIFDGKIHIRYAGDYEFAVDGDDAVEVIIDGTVVAGWYDGHGKCNCTTYSGSISLTQGEHTIEFRHEEASGGDNYYLYWNGPDSNNHTGGWEIVPYYLLLDGERSGLDQNITQTVYTLQAPASTITDYVVRIKVANPSMLESNCKLYPSGVYKPIGILQRHGESDRMYFGLITGSYTKNTSGGVLRKNIGSITDEIVPDTGQFTLTNGIIKTIDDLRIVGFDYGSHSYNQNCGWVATRPINEGECRMWGNPIGEMMYEGLRYFAGKAAPTSDFTYAGANDDSSLGLPLPTWQDPYDAVSGFDYCAKPFMLVLSDINPTYDSDQLPGSYFGSFTGDLSGLDVENRADTICTDEGDAGSHFIGQSDSAYNGACTEKTVTGFGGIRGLCPEEPTKQGSYYAASVAYFGQTEDMSDANSSQNVNTYAVGLASPLPKINIPVGDGSITLVPFGKSVGGYSISATQGDFQPTNTIVDFYVETITPTHGKFRINFEDVEQGADHDMDAIVEYEYWVNGNSVEIILNSTYAAGSIAQHIGYIISGTTADGTYLEVRDFDTANPPYGNNPAIDPDYFLDTPPGQGPGETWNDNNALPLITKRTFTVGENPAATLLKNPLWYAAKWGGFEDRNDNDKPDLDNEWDKDMDGVPDTYFYVTNPLRLEEQLNKSFADILRRTSSGTAASVISNSRSGEGAIYQSIFFPEYKGPLGNITTWAGEVHALVVDAYGNMREDTNGNKQLDLTTDKIIVFDGTTAYKYGDDDGDSQISGDEETPDETGGILDIRYLWSSNGWLNEISDADIVDQRTYDSTDHKRYIFTFIDTDQDMIADSGEVIPFSCSSLPSVPDLTDTSEIYPYLTLYPSFSDEPAEIGTIRSDGNFNDFLQYQTQRVINYIRGKDQGLYTSTTSPSYAIPAFRNRKVDYDEDGTVETWRLGDIVYSTPTFVGRPSENYHLLYKDASYGMFYDKYMHRRGVVYVGGNDGMFHAFNAGFYDQEEKKFRTQPLNSNGDNDTSFTKFDLGAELWAYVPYNLLPHLYWLTEPDYAHVYYCDLKPRIFDAKVFDDNSTHPEGWGTILVGGMRFGGGEIDADMDKNGSCNATDRTMSSAYFILDITDPESPPTLLAEITFDNLGYTICYPGVIPMKDKDSDGIHANDWYLVVGSGPAAADGTADFAALNDADSKQSAKLYAIDLVALVTNQQLMTLDNTGSLVSGSNIFQELDSNSFISDPITVDYDLDYNADALYCGTVSGDSTNGWGGKLRRVVIKNDLTTSNWDGDSILIDLTGIENGQPITTAPSVAIDPLGNKWIYFGTGRFFVLADGNNTDQQAYYGIKEPVDGDGNMTWATVSRVELLDVSNAEVSTDKTMTGVAGVTDWDDLVNEIENETNGTSGWYLNFSEPKERNLGQATLLGDILAFTTYIPPEDICDFEGESYLYALYYLTGTAYYESVIGTDGGTGPQQVLKKLSLGQGLSITPNIHVGKGDAPKLFIQTSTGAIFPVKQISPGITKSGVSSWKDGCN